MSQLIYPERVVNQRQPPHRPQHSSSISLLHCNWKSLQEELQRLGCPFTCLSWHPSSWRKLRASGPSAQDVSTVTGMKWWLLYRWAYLALFNCSAMAPASLAATATWEGVNVSGHVASHTNTLPLCHGTMQMPSGCFPSDRYRPGGSMRERTLAAVNDLWMILLTAAWQGWHP